MLQNNLSQPYANQFDDSHDSSTVLRKRKLTFSCSLDLEETRMATNKRRKREMRLFDDKIAGIDSYVTVDLNLPHLSIICSENDDVFEWMENLLGNGRGGEQTFTEEKNKKMISIPRNEDVNVDSLLTLNEADPCFEEMISLLAQGESDDSINEKNMFKEIQESFIYDRLPELNFSTFTRSQSNFPSLKKPYLRRSSSFNTRRVRSSRIGIRDGFDQLVKANRLTAKTRYMLLTCTPSFLNCKRYNQ